MMVFPRNEARSVCLVTGRVRGEGAAARHGSFCNPQASDLSQLNPYVKKLRFRPQEDSPKRCFRILWIPGPTLDD